MSELSIEVKNLKTIDHLSFSINLSPGVNVLCGGNGVGKTTLLYVLAKLFNNNAYRDYFYNSSTNESEIDICFGCVVNKWRRVDNGRSFKWENQGGDNISINGFIEGSFIHGNRFKYANVSMMLRSGKMNNKNPFDVDDTVRENLGLILRDDKNYYSKLQGYYPLFPKKVNGKDPSKIELVPSDRPLFIMEVDGKSIHHHDMSSGEFIVASLLEFIDSEIKKIAKRPNRTSDVSLVILDEIEVGLHPSALDRLMRHLNKISKSHKICFLISTHNPATMSSLQKGNIFLLQKSKVARKEIKLINPCFPAYAIRATKDMSGYDKIIFVEDKLAKKIVERAMIKAGLSHNNIYKVMSVGGWRKVVEIHNEFLQNNLGGMFCKYISILDGDVDELPDSEEYITSYPSCSVKFLPIQSLEKFLFRKLLVEDEWRLFNSIEGAFFNNSDLSFEVVISDYLDDNPNYLEKDKKGKNLLKAIKNRAKQKGVDEAIVESTLCDIAMEYIRDDESDSYHALEAELRRFYQ